MTIKFQKILEEAVIPHYAHPGDAGLDIFSAEETIIKSGERENNIKKVFLSRLW